MYNPKKNGFRWIYKGMTVYVISQYRIDTQTVTSRHKGNGNEAEKK